MSKILEASCNASGIVTCEGFQIDGVTVLSEGKQDSTGVLIVDGLKTYYITSNASDLVTTLDKISLALTQIATALNAIDAKPTGGTGSASTPVAAGNVTQINTIKSEVDTLKGALK